MDEIIQTVGTDEGGRYLWPAGAEVVPVGEHGMPRRLIYTHGGGDEQPACVIEIEVWDGAAVCTRAELTGKPDSRIAVKSEDLRALARMVDTVIERAGVMFGFSGRSSAGWAQASQAPMAERQGRLQSVRGPRRSTDNPVFLKGVADLYKEAPAPKLEFVADELGCSPRSAARYVVAARGSGFIDD